MASLALLTTPALAGPVLQWTEAAPRDQILRDWLQQDGADPGACFTEARGHAAERAAVEHALSSLQDRAAGEAFRRELQALVAAGAPGTDARWRDLYDRVCTARRQERLSWTAGLQARTGSGSGEPRSFVYTRHYNLGGSHYAYTEGQSDAQAERHFVAGAALCLLKLDGPFAQTATLVDAPTGVIRDPDVDYDGRHVLFSWKKSDREDDYHLYEYDMETGQVRQITEGLGFADYEGVYLPDGQILFNSTRCVQIVDCWWTEVSNLYLCRRDGRALRRLGYDQVHTNCPQVLGDGRVVYTRWDYNDRGQIFPQALFQMNPDGTGQAEYYGNNSWFPTTLIHARPLPGEDRLLAIATGHHSDQSGKLVVVDRTRGQQENEGVQLIAPVRDTPAVRVDAYGQDGEQFGYPYPVDSHTFLVAYAPAGEPREGLFAKGHFGLYWMDMDGRRELLAWDAARPCNQPVALVPRARPPTRPSAVDYRQTQGTFFLQDIYAGAGLSGVARGAIKRLRVVGLDFRAAGIRANGSNGPAGAAMASTPIAVGNGSWDVKTVYGEAEVQADGSAWFTAPARTALYFQALDARGRAVQTMRSWATLQPGEYASCVGCHEPKPAAPVVSRPATPAGPQALRPFYGLPRGFSFIREVQPLLDRRCIACHADRSASRPGAAEVVSRERLDRATPLHPADMAWQFTTDKPPTGWEQPASDAGRWASGVPGFGTQGTPGIQVKTVWRTPDIWLRGSFTLDRDLAGHQLAAMTYHDEDVEIYLNGVRAAEATGYVVAAHPLAVKPAAAAALHRGVNTIAVHCHQTVGGQGVSVVLLDLGAVEGPDTIRPMRNGGPADSRPLRVFSLLGTQTPEAASGRQWSDAYLALTNAYVNPGQGYLAGHPTPLVNWVGAQSAPPILPPNSVGATQSRLLGMLDAGHHGVKLSTEEYERLACWIDLNIPYCGDYTEANCWTDAEKAKYDHLLQKRRLSDALERQGVAEWLAGGL
ncbi:hypothetical protein LLH23_16385 [bacterium]|nr:hypothetical protein [bacterium]